MPVRHVRLTHREVTWRRQRIIGRQAVRLFGQTALLHFEGAPTFQRPAQRELVGVFQVASDRQAAGQPRDTTIPSGVKSRATYIAVASPSRLGFVQTMTS